MTGALVAVIAALTLAGCSTTPADPAQGGRVAGGIPETPVITGEPAGHNADDVSFAANVIAHSRQAIELTELVSERSTNPELAALASKIAAEQQPEINIMNVFLVQWRENPELSADPGAAEGPAQHGQAPAGMVDGETMEKLKSLRGSEFDTLWLKSMIGHTEGALEMANAEIANGANVDAVAMAQSMAATQEAEIERLKQILEGSER
ncbi:MAG: DUF305 domain-containing protein [Actinomycetia bacterium]|nr:DUF305 domain-containing protein [Actinomycetes bacterium]MCH9700918.1 DUF305 domain-containing protein [Actinomycetes bacterium]MCH9762599.1 DUF305 domain-containing protein [Actinomycetes bacterium]